MTKVQCGSQILTFLKVNNRCNHLFGLFSGTQFEMLDLSASHLLYLHLSPGLYLCRLSCICASCCVWDFYLQNVGSGGRRTSWSRPGIQTWAHPSTSCTAFTANASRWVTFHIFYSVQSWGCISLLDSMCLDPTSLHNQKLVCEVSEKRIQSDKLSDPERQKLNLSSSGWWWDWAEPN